MSLSLSHKLLATMMFIGVLSLSPIILSEYLGSPRKAKNYSESLLLNSLKLVQQGLNKTQKTNQAIARLLAKQSFVTYTTRNGTNKAIQRKLNHLKQDHSLSRIQILRGTDLAIQADSENQLTGKEFGHQEILENSHDSNLPIVFYYDNAYLVSFSSVSNHQGHLGWIILFSDLNDVLSKEVFPYLDAPLTLVTGKKEKMIRTMFASNPTSSLLSQVFKHYKTYPWTVEQTDVVELSNQSVISRIVPLANQQDYSLYALAAYPVASIEPAQASTSTLMIIALMTAALAYFVANYLNKKIVVPIMDVSESALETISNQNNPRGSEQGLLEIQQLFLVLGKAKQALQKFKTQREVGSEDQIRKKINLDNEKEHTNLDLTKVNLLLKIAQSTHLLAIPEEVMEFVLEHIVSSYHFDRASILLFDPQNTVLKLEAVKGFDTKTKKILTLTPKSLISFQIGEGIAGRAFEEQKILIADKGSQDPTFKRYKNTLDETVNFLACLPLIAGKRSFGVLNLASRSRDKSLDETDLDYLSALAHQTAIALEKARVFDSSMIDTDSDMFNSRYFRSRLLVELRRAYRRRKPLALAFIEIDNHPRITQEYGSQFSEEVLNHVATVIRKTVRVTDIPSRYLSSSFAVLLHDCYYDGSEKFTKRLQAEIHKNPMRQGKQVYPISLSIGVSIFPVDGNGGRDLLDMAEKALEIAKKKGGNCMINFKKSMAS